MKLDPNYEEATLNLGYTYDDSGSAAEALEQFKKIVRMNPRNIEAHNKIGQLLAKQNKFDAAVFAFQEALEKNPKSAELYNNLGNVYYDRGNLKEAFANFGKAAEIDPKFKENYTHLGIASFDADKVEDAIKAMEGSLKNNLNKAKANHDLGALYMQQGHGHDKAIASFQASIAVDGAFPLAHANLGFAYEKKGQLAEAVKCFEKVTVLQGKSAKNWNTLGQLLVKAKRPADAARAYRQAVKLDPSYANTQMVLGQAYSVKGPVEKAVDAYMMYVRIHESGPSVDDAKNRIAGLRNISLEQLEAELAAQGMGQASRPGTPSPCPRPDYMAQLKAKLAANRPAERRRPPLAACSSIRRPWLRRPGARWLRRPAFSPPPMLAPPPLAAAAAPSLAPPPLAPLKPAAEAAAPPPLPELSASKPNLPELVRTAVMAARSAQPSAPAPAQPMAAPLPAPPPACGRSPGHLQLLPASTRTRLWPYVDQASGYAVYLVTAPPPGPPRAPSAQAPAPVVSAPMAASARAHGLRPWLRRIRPRLQRTRRLQRPWRRWLPRPPPPPPAGPLRRRSVGRNTFGPAEPAPPPSPGTGSCKGFPTEGFVLYSALPLGPKSTVQSPWLGRANRLNAAPPRVALGAIEWVPLISLPNTRVLRTSTRTISPR